MISISAAFMYDENNFDETINSEGNISRFGGPINGYAQGNEEILYLTWQPNKKKIQ